MNTQEEIGKIVARSRYMIQQRDTASGSWENVSDPIIGKGLVSAVRATNDYHADHDDMFTRLVDLNQREDSPIYVAHSRTPMRLIRAICPESTAV